MDQGGNRCLDKGTTVMVANENSIGSREPMNSGRKYSEFAGFATKSSLSHNQMQLLELMQRINYGRIEGLRISHGEPLLNPSPRIVKEIKFGGSNGPRREATKVDFTLKNQMRDLFAQLEIYGTGVIPCIEVQSGLPFRMTIEEVAA